MILYLFSIVLLFSTISFSMQTSKEAQAPAPITCTTKITENNETGEKTFLGTYAFENCKGLVRIKSALLGNSLMLPDGFTTREKINLSIFRHRNNSVIFKALLNKNIIRSYPQKDISPLIWMPWMDDTIANPQQYSQPQRSDAIRSGNRLVLSLRSFGSYHVTVPNDADIEAEFESGDIEYKSDEPSMVRVESTSINKPGNSGGGGIQHYYWGSYSDPYTKLFTKQGHATVLREKPE